MKSESELYDDFFDWLDEAMGPVKVPTLFASLPGFEMPASDFLTEIRRAVFIGDRHDQYCDVLFELWKEHVCVEK